MLLLIIYFLRVQIFFFCILIIQHISGERENRENQEGITCSGVEPGRGEVQGRSNPENWEIQRNAEKVNSMVDT